jgi:membrane protein required for colicin V production
VQHPSFNWFDIVLIIFLVWSSLAGLRAGLARVVVSIVAAIAGFLAGFWFGGLVAEQVLPWVRNATAASIIGFFAVFIGALLLGALVSALLSRIFHWIGLSWLNHALGGVAGFLRGALILAALVGILVAYSPSPTPAYIQNSRVLPYVGEISWWLVDLAPRQLRDAFTEQMQNLRQLWSQPPPGHSVVA